MAVCLYVECCREQFLVWWRC